ncbi:MAG: hypothetical protein C0443_02390 [Comamonadaceae bacterium]|nr:hypothetical protein [Comamonadaceae bacterium]
MTCVEVTAASAQTSAPVTFGQPFKTGDFSPSQGLVARYSDGSNVPLQIDEVSTHSDGSVRFAVLSAQLNSLPAGQPRLVNLFTAAKTASTPSIPANPAWNLELEATTASGTLIAQPQAQLVTQIASGQGRRLSGSVASEFTVVTPFKDKTTGTPHPHLVARMHVRLYDGGNRIRTEVVMENTRAFTPNKSNITYALAIKRNGSTVHSQPSFTHFHQARWRKVVWTGGSEPQLQLRHNMPYFIASRATWNYNLGIYEGQAAKRESVLNNMASTLASRNTQPMGNALLQHDFPGTGGRPEIGPLPMWTAMYLITQDNRARASMMAVADAAASVPIHYRDEKTDQPMDVENNPNVTVRFGTSSPAIPKASSSTPWTPDTAHQGSFAYIPYLITGDAFYLDETLFWATYNMISLDPSYRAYAQGIVHEHETRSQAWALRSLGEAAFATPDSHPMKNHFTSRLNNNLQWYANHYQATNTRVSPLGANENHTDHALPWQHDFLTIVYAWLAENNANRAREHLLWLSNFAVGRYTSDDKGFCSANADGYVWRIGSGGVFINNWKTLYDTNYASNASKACSTIPYDDDGCAYCYGAIGLSMLAATTNAAVPNASTGYTKIAPKFPITRAALLNDPTWAIIPR